MYIDVTNNDVYVSTAEGTWLKAISNGAIVAGMENPMTAAGDIIIGGINGAPTKLAKGANGTFLGVDENGQLAYAQAGGDLYLHAMKLYVSGASDSKLGMVLVAPTSQKFNTGSLINYLKESGWQSMQELPIWGQYTRNEEVFQVYSLAIVIGGTSRINSISTTNVYREVRSISDMVYKLAR